MGALDEEHTAIWEEWQTADRPMIAPLLLRYEVTNALHRMRSQARADEVQVQSALRALIQMPIRYIDDDLLPVEALAVARGFYLDASYDAHYVALAARYGAELWTSDRKLWAVVSYRLDWVHYAPERPTKSQ
jgi:predicted nucleic acid-binding protein